MSDLVIYKKNEAFLQIKCEQHIAKELSEYFTFFVPGHKFTPAFRNKIWDGKIRLFDLRNNSLYLGLLDYVKEFCNSREYTIEYTEPSVNIEDEFSRYHAEKFVDSLKLQSQSKDILTHDHQLDAFINVMQRRRALLLSPTASGKSLIIYLFIRQFLEFQGLKGLILVPTTSLVEQLHSDFEDYSTNNGFNTEKNTQKIYSGQEKNYDNPITISTWQSMQRMPDEFFQQFDFVIGDEAHLFKAKELTRILAACINTKYRIGLTGTLDGTKTHKLVLEGLFGSVKKVISTKELIDKGILSGFEVKCLVLKHSPEICVEMKDATYQEELQYLILNEQRNKFIKNLAVSMKTNTLVLYQMVDKHGKILYNMIKDTEKIGDRKVFFVSGGTETSEREEIRKIVEEENDAIIVASFGTFSTGINIRNLHNIIFASPSKSRVRNLQSIGRGLRKSTGKEIATLYDIADDLRHKKHTNHTLNHFMERVDIYNEEKFPFKIYNIGLKNG